MGCFPVSVRGSAALLDGIWLRSDAFFFGISVAFLRLKNTKYQQMKTQFCNACYLSNAIPTFIANELLGVKQLQILMSRYQHMRECYDFSYAEWQDVFTPELKPFRGYTDTTSVCMPVLHPLFKQDFERINKGAIGLDVPTWYNVQENNPCIMFIAQDPLRHSKWYGDCRDAVVSSPFGLHDATHRKRGNGGKMLNLLVQKLVDDGYAIYLTDAIKFFIHDPEISHAYSKSRMDVYVQILQKEIDLVKPSLCVCLGNRAKSVFDKCGVDTKAILLPHLSGAARGAIIRRFPVLKENKATSERVAQLYADEIIKSLKY